MTSPRKGSIGAEAGLLLLTLLLMNLTAKPMGGPFGTGGPARSAGPDAVGQKLITFIPVDSKRKFSSFGQTV